ncbi:MAG TPA: molybdopterin-dependent oxidoreductase, partial [Alphaproteobacteria bacterium]|nr:molybdopterin-dependent oxidoreductase [Alphaproteobacteria bacterium]
MDIKRKKGWELPDSAATPEHAFLNRRRFIRLGAGGLAVAGAGALWALNGRDDELANVAVAQEVDPSAGLYPAARNMRYRLDRDITDEKVATTYNNFYEFGSSKNIWQAAQRLPLRPWEIKIDGMVEKERIVGIDDVLKSVAVEERLYRHRCVEAWAMAVPWTGIPMKAFVEYAKPLSSAKYVRMETFNRPEVAPGMKASWYPWPYVEGLTIEEAT